MLAQSKDILDALEKNLGMKVQGFVATDYNGVIEALRAKHLDIAYLGPFSYVLATTVTPVEAFAIAETAKAGRTYYHSQIIAQKSSGIKTLEDLKGKNFAFVDPASTSGYAFPAGRSPEGRHRAQARLQDGDLHRRARRQRRGRRQRQGRRRHHRRPHPRCRHRQGPHQGRRDRGRVALRPDPESPMVWRKDLSPELKDKVKAAFLAIKDLNWSDQGKLNGFKETNDQAYDVVRETAKLANIDLKKQQKR